MTVAYLGFAAILAVAVAAAFGATSLPEVAVPYLGLLPLALGLKAAWQAWKHRGSGEEEEEAQAKEGGPSLLEVAAVTFANGGDNIGVYVPVFATAGVGGMSVYAVVFLVLVAVWCFDRPELVPGPASAARVRTGPGRGGRQERFDGGRHGRQPVPAEAVGGRNDFGGVRQGRVRLPEQGVVREVERGQGTAAASSVVGLDSSRMRPPRMRPDRAYLSHCGPPHATGRAQRATRTAFEQSGDRQRKRAVGRCKAPTGFRRPAVGHSGSSLRRGATHDVLACWSGVDRSTVTRAVGEVR
ncbi:cadmium resistance transporter [Streptomyces sp. NPDC048258]|uniref:cadmium resistance transporter n=1 Tax=Streptomyces sp. NPDC048258 TaxID=3365527 RepID=UPI003716CE30